LLSWEAGESASAHNITILASEKADYFIPIAMSADKVSALPTKRVLGINFFHGPAEEAVNYISTNGGLVVAPAAPSFIALQDDPEYRRAITDADLAIADSGWMVNFWWLLHRERLVRISGLKFFKQLLERPECREAGKLFWILPSETAKTRTLAWAQREQFPLTSDDLYVAPRYADDATDEKLLGIIRQRKPHHIVVAIGGGMQDKIGSYIKSNCGYRPGIYCIGAAPGFVTGDQVRIPMWADRFFVGWIFRVIAQPRTLLPRFWSARRLPWMLWKYRDRLPVLASD
jgi:UDP-N-acetyl-D-mannosaminuronic acid transferase (WecB/TagA/CpsF family)